MYTYTVLSNLIKGEVKMYETTEIEALKQRIKSREDEIKRLDMMMTHPTYSINRYDDEGYSYDDGIFLHPICYQRNLFALSYSSVE